MHEYIAHFLFDLMIPLSGVCCYSIFKSDAFLHKCMVCKSLTVSYEVVFLTDVVESNIPKDILLINVWNPNLLIFAVMDIVKSVS